MTISGPGATASFSYVALGRRISRTIKGGTTQSLYDRLDILQEVTATWHCEQPPRPRLRRALGPRRQRVLGSIIALADPSGLLTTSYTYDPFGQTTFAGVAPLNPFQFTAREHDTPTRLYSYRARYSSPVLHRFISEDPVGLRSGDPNFYAYVGNNPIDFVDPFGLDKERKDCQDPDYFAATLNYSPTLPVVGTLFGASGQLIVDRFGNIYAAGGFNVGRSLTIVSGSATHGFLEGERVPSEEALKSFWGGFGLSAGGGFIFGTNIVYSPGTGRTAREFGYFSPQIGGSVTFAVPLIKIPALASPCN